MHAGAPRDITGEKSEFKPKSKQNAPSQLRVRHRSIEIDWRGNLLPGRRTCGRTVVLLPHGYPSSSFQFRNFMPAFADRWRLIAPDEYDAFHSMIKG